MVTLPRDVLTVSNRVPFDRAIVQRLVVSSGSWPTPIEIWGCQNVLILRRSRSSVVLPSSHHLLLTMDPTAPPSALAPTTPNRPVIHAKMTTTPNILSGHFSTSSLPVCSTQRALKASLTGNVVFANEAVVDAVFQPSKVDENTVSEIIAEINSDTKLNNARNKLLRSKIAESKMYQPMVRHPPLTRWDGVGSHSSRSSFSSTYLATSTKTRR